MKHADVLNFLHVYNLIFKINKIIFTFPRVFIYDNTTKKFCNVRIVQYSSSIMK